MAIAAKGVDVVVHLAAALAQFVRDETAMRAVNVGGTANALAAAWQNGAKKFIFASSVEVYGVIVPIPCPEDAPMNPVCEYGRNKVESENICHEYLAKGMNVTIFRPPTINGPGQNEPTLLSQVHSAFMGKALLMPGGGKTRLQMVYVDDVSRAIMLAIDLAEASRGAVLNLGSDDVPTFKEMATALFQRAGKKPKFININASIARGLVKFLAKFGKSPVEPQHLEIALRDYMFDTTQAKKVLGWSPTKTDIETAVETYDWHVAQQKAKES